MSVRSTKDFDEKSPTPSSGVSELVKLGSAEAGTVSFSASSFTDDSSGAGPVSGNYIADRHTCSKVQLEQNAEQFHEKK